MLPFLTHNRFLKKICGAFNVKRNCHIVHIQGSIEAGYLNEALGASQAVSNRLSVQGRPPIIIQQYIYALIVCVCHVLVGNSGREEGEER